LRESILAVEQAQERLHRVEAELAEAARTSRHAAVMAALQALRGVGLVTAVTLVAELGDLQRFRTPREAMAYAAGGATESDQGDRLAGAGSVASTVSASAGAREGTPAGRGGPGTPGVYMGRGSCCQGWSAEQR